jgi:hypothetical protein
MVSTAAVWLSDDLLLACVPHHVGSGDCVGVPGAPDDGRAVHDVRCVSYATDAQGVHTVILVRLDRAAGESAPATLDIRLDEGSLRIDLREATTDLQSLCRERLAILDAQTRARVLELAASSLQPERDSSSRAQLSRNLLVAREALRERLPYSSTGDDTAQVQVDAIVAADDRAFLITGWMTGTGTGVASLTAVAPEGTRVDLLPRICRHPHRQFQDAQGFTSSCVLDSPSVLEEGWRIELLMLDGTGVETKAPRAVTTLASARRSMFDLLAPADAPIDALMAGHLFPVFDRLQKRWRAGARVEGVVECGRPVDAPEISIVVPLGDRPELLEHQLAQFAADPELRTADLIYVHGDTASRNSLADRAAHLGDLYRVPFRVAMLSDEAGFAASIDAGATLARGGLLLLLLPDVLPEQPGWLARLARLYRDSLDIGALIPTLLSAGGTVHAAPASGVSAGSLMIDRNIFHKVGGLCGRYMQGDFESADLCLRLAQAGRRTGQAIGVALYDVREESRIGSMRKVDVLYDEWVHRRVWQDARSVDLDPVQ